MNSSRRYMSVVASQSEGAERGEYQAEKLRGAEETDGARFGEEEVQEDKTKETDECGAGERHGKSNVSFVRRILGPDPKERLKALGSGALLSYGCVSNFFYITAVHVAYYAGAKQTGISPLYDATSRSTFFTVYAGLFALNNVLRPLRVSLSVVLAPAFERLRRSIASRFEIGPKASFICVVSLVNVIGSFAYLFSGVGAVSVFLRVAVLPS